MAGVPTNKTVRFLKNIKYASSGKREDVRKRIKDQKKGPQEQGAQSSKFKPTERERGTITRKVDPEKSLRPGGPVTDWAGSLQKR